MTLKAELRAMAEEAAKKLAWPHNSEDDVPTIESALHAAVKRVLGQVQHRLEEMATGSQEQRGMVEDHEIGLHVYSPMAHLNAHRAMTAQLLREIEE